MISQTSRYGRTGTAVFVTPGGTEINYLRRRFLPDPAQYTVLTLHSVSEGERPDIISARYLGDPEMFWQICDSNGVMRADELTKAAGNILKIPLITG